MKRTCSICNIEKTHIFSYKSGKQRIFKDENNKHWNGSHCPSCFKKRGLERSRTVERKKQLKQYRQVHKEKYQKYMDGYNKDWRKNNPKYFADWMRKRRKNDSFFKLRSNLRSRLYKVLNGKKDRSVLITIGCSLQDLKQHIEKQFKPGMSWENWSFNGWHIDHIIPLASAKTDEEVYKLNHYTNLQPLWAKENRSKKDRIN